MTDPGNATAAGGEPHGRVPDFFIVGHPKCGTTALYEMLRRHPQIHMPVKEPWFFAPDRLPTEPAGYPSTLDDYLALFKDAEPTQIIGEASPVYLMSHVAARRIAELRPDARIIAIVREPASFLRSLHLQSVQDHVETEKKLGRAIALEGERREGRKIPRHTDRPQELLYSEHVRYVEQLRRYYDRFPRAQVLVLVYEDFRDDNEATVRRVQRFLEVDDQSPVELLQANPSVGVRSQRLDDFVRSLYLGRGPFSRALKTALKALTPRQLRRDAQRALRRHVVWGEPPAAGEDVMRDLRRRFRGEVVALSEYLKRDLVRLWGYDKAD